MSTVCWLLLSIYSMLNHTCVCHSDIQSRLCCGLLALFRNGDESTALIICIAFHVCNESAHVFAAQFRCSFWNTSSKSQMCIRLNSILDDFQFDLRLLPAYGFFLVRFQNEAVGRHWDSSIAVAITKLYILHIYQFPDWVKINLSVRNL